MNYLDFLSVVFQSPIMIINLEEGKQIENRRPCGLQHRVVINLE